jgi:hypothetical protein
LIKTAFLRCRSTMAMVERTEVSTEKTLRAEGRQRAFLL